MTIFNVPLDLWFKFMNNLQDSGMMQYLDEAFFLTKTEQDPIVYTVTQLHDHNYIPSIQFPSEPPSSPSQLQELLAILAKRVSWLRQQIRLHKITVSLAVTFPYLERYSAELSETGESTFLRDYWVHKISHVVPGCVLQRIDKDIMILIGAWLDNDGWVGRPFQVPEAPDNGPASSEDGDIVMSDIEQVGSPTFWILGEEC